MPQDDRALKAKPQGDQRRRGPNEDLVESGASPEQRELLRLQRLAGNAAVAQVLQREAPNAEEEALPGSAAALLGGLGNLGKILGESGVVGSGPGTSQKFASASGVVGGGAGPNLREAPVVPATPSSGATSAGLSGLGNVGKMLGEAGVLSGPNLPVPQAAAGPARKGNIGEETGPAVGGAVGPVAGAVPAGGGFIGGPLSQALGTALDMAGKSVSGAGGTAGGISGALTQAPKAGSGPPATGGGFFAGPVGGALGSAIGAAGKTVSGAKPATNATDPRSATLAASAGRFSRDAEALGIQGAGELIDSTLRALADRLPPRR